MKFGDIKIVFSCFCCEVDRQNLTNFQFQNFYLILIHSKNTKKAENNLNSMFL